MRHLDFDGYASKWGLTDFYEDAELILRDTIESGDDFDTGWFGCKKEIRYARYERNEGGFHITVEAHMDDLWDGEGLIYDTLSDLDIDGEVSDEIIDEVRAIAMEVGIDDVTCVFAELPRDASFDDVVRETEKAENEAESNNEDMFRRLCDIVNDIIERENGNQQFAQTEQ